ncbi:hypothetical protein [Chryseobacterium indologenes]|uniref:hypothetical protein n=1 Tax=Chryseobacterium indologenes TaxID=253 RepID=UPI0030178155
MIAPQELRLGNLVTIDNPDFHKKMKGIPVIVNGINFRIERDFPKSTASISVTDGKFSYDQFNEFISPIELNEDWLFKLGYECNKNEYSISGHDRFNVFQSVKGPYIFCDDKIAIKYVKYVHELQNIFFALTGEELTIKES